jgi:hypothetical protein
MSWNRSWSGNARVHERAEALRQQHEAEMERAQRTRRDDMAKSPTGVTRASLKTGDAQEAVGRLNRRLDEALDKVRTAMEREAQERDAEDTARRDAARRAPALGGGN